MALHTSLPIYKVAWQVLRPWRRTLRRRTLNAALARVAERTDDELLQTVNSYFGLLRQASKSHRDRALLANLARRLGRSVDLALTRTFQRSA